MKPTVQAHQTRKLGVTQMTLRELQKLISKIQSQHSVVFEEFKIKRGGATFTYTDAQSLTDEEICDPKIEAYECSFRRHKNGPNGWVNFSFDGIQGNSVKAHGSDESWVNGIAPVIENEMRLYRVRYGFLKRGGITRIILGCVTYLYIRMCLANKLEAISNEDLVDFGVNPDVVGAVAVLGTYAVAIGAAWLVVSLGNVKSRIVPNDLTWQKTLTRQEIWAILATAGALGSLGLSAIQVLNG